VLHGETDHATINSGSLGSAMDLIHCSAGRNFKRCLTTRSHFALVLPEGSPRRLQAYTTYSFPFVGLSMQDISTVLEMIEPWGGDS